MIVRSLDSDGDWMFGKGRNDYKSANKAISQNLQTRVLSFLGDCFFDAAAGIDWITFLGGSKSPLVVNLAVSTTIIKTDGITGLLQLSLTLNSVERLLGVQYAVTTIYSAESNQFVFDLNGII